ncbi:hypothetical protein [Candidatus Jettenia sp. AMX1]|nr:hypothetical protein [Candidatus Jettenia sp. AMX1]
MLSIRKLILSDENTTVGDIMNSDVVSVHTLDDQEKVASLFKRYDFTTD